MILELPDKCQQVIAISGELFFFKNKIDKKYSKYLKQPNIFPFSWFLFPFYLSFLTSILKMYILKMNCYS